MLMIRLLVNILSWFLPWPVRRVWLRATLGFRLHPSSSIGFAVILAKKVILEEGSRIDHLTLCRKLDLLHLRAAAYVGRLNWIMGAGSDDQRHFASSNRNPELIVGQHAAITHRHLIDCTDRISVGDFATVAGFRSQMITHWIDLAKNQQVCAPISIGRYTYVGTASVILGGAALPDFSVLGAQSVLRSAHEEPYGLYAGVPARRIKELAPDSKYFLRSRGPVD